MQTSAPLSAAQDLDTPNRRLTGMWLWAVRAGWFVVMIVMVLLILGVIVNSFRRNIEGTGTLGADYALNERNEWALTPEPGGPASDTGIRAGDVLVGLDDLVVSGDTSYLTLANRLAVAPGTELVLRVRGLDGAVSAHSVRMRKDLAGEITESLAPHAVWAVYYTLLEMILLLTWLGTAVFIFWQRSDDWLVALVSLTLALATIELSYAWWQFQVAYPQSESLLDRLTTLGAILALPVFYLFPDGRFVPRWTILLTAVWVVWTVAQTIFPNSPITLSAWPDWAAIGIYLLWYGTGILAQTYRYRRAATDVQRQQTKWVIVGLTATVVARYGWELAFQLPALAAPGWPSVLMFLIGRLVYVAVLLVLPISLLIAIRRYHLWDTVSAHEATSSTSG